MFRLLKQFSIILNVEFHRVSVSRLGTSSLFLLIPRVTESSPNEARILVELETILRRFRKIETSSFISFVESTTARLIIWHTHRTCQSDDKQAFRLVESKSFEVFCKSMNKHFTLPSRRTLARATEDQYDFALVQFKKDIEEIPGRVAITLDGWSSVVMRGYLVITMHWVDSSWTLRNALFANPESDGEFSKRSSNFGRVTNNFEKIS
jgi:hypothetical protein